MNHISSSTKSNSLRGPEPITDQQLVDYNRHLVSQSIKAALGSGFWLGMMLASFGFGVGCGAAGGFGDLYWKLLFGWIVICFLGFVVSKAQS